MTRRKPRKEVIKVEGISYTRWRWPGGGSVIESPCGCYGHRDRLHTSIACPWMEKRTGRSYPWRDQT